mgnify:CR=1 FL=1
MKGLMYFLDYVFHGYSLDKDRLLTMEEQQQLQHVRERLELVKEQLLIIERRAVQRKKPL